MHTLSASAYDDILSKMNEVTTTDDIMTTSALNVTKKIRLGGSSRFIPLMLDDSPLTVTVYGYLSPPLVLLTVITNCLVCVVLLRRELRNATNALLVAMAISDTMTGVLPSPCFVYFYSAGHFADWVPPSWCFVYFCLTDYLPTVTHTASIWLTVALAVQRYVCVCHATSGLARHAGVVRNVVAAIVVVYALAVASHACRFAELQFDVASVRSRVDSSLRIAACSYSFAPFVQRNENLYFNVYYWYRVVAIHIVPCSALVVLNALLVRTIRNAQRRRRQLLHDAGNGRNRVAYRRLSESSSRTLMLVVVVGLLLLVELPMAVFLVVTIVENTFAVMIVSPETTRVAALIVNYVVLLSYPLNFFVYCGMSEQFRRTFRQLCCRCAKGSGRSAAVAAFRPGDTRVSETTGGIIGEMGESCNGCHPLESISMTTEDCEGPATRRRLAPNDVSTARMDVANDRHVGVSNDVIDDETVRLSTGWKVSRPDE